MEDEKQQNRYEQRLAEDAAFEHDAIEHWKASDKHPCGAVRCLYCIDIMDKLDSVEPMSDAYIRE